MIDRLRDFRKSLLLISKIGVVAVLVLGFYYTWQQNYYRTDFFYFKGNLLLIFLYVAILLVFLMTYNATKYGIFRLSEIIYSYALALFMTNLIAYIILILIAREIIPILPTFYLFLFQLLFASVASYFINKLYFLLYPAREVLVIRPIDSDPLRLIRKMQMKKERYKIKAILSEELPMHLLEKAILEYQSVLVCNIQPRRRSDLLEFCALHEKRVYFTPTPEDVLVKNANETQVFDTPLYYCKNSGLSTEHQFMKRGMDLIIAFLGGIILSPLMLITAICIKIGDGGPVFFKQERLTKDGKVFNLYKFRSMVVNAEEAGAQLAEKNDARITKVGNVIRKVRIDELPQILNVLNGDMSIVGPRPERPEIAAQYESLYPEFALRLQVKAGLTGYAQIYGKYNTTPWDKLLMDLMYIESYSILQDIRLILLTVKILFMPESTEGIDQGSVLPVDIQVTEVSDSDHSKYDEN